MLQVKLQTGIILLCTQKSNETREEYKQLFAYERTVGTGQSKKNSICIFLKLIPNWFIGVFFFLLSTSNKTVK